MPVALTLTTPTDVIAALPYLVGEPPDPGIVVVVLNGTHARAALVADLARVPAHREPLEHARVAAALAAEEGCTGLVVVAFGPPGAVGAHLDGLIRAARETGLLVHDALRVTDGRYWSHACRTPGCCPPEGTALDTDRSCVPASAVLLGIAPASPVLSPAGGPDRPRALSVPRSAEATAVMEGVTADVERRARRMAEEAGEAALERRGVRALLDALHREGEGRGVTGDEELAWLGVHLTRTRARDEVWARITREQARTHGRLWARVAARVCPRHRPAPASLLAVAAWQDGDEPLARAALDLALAVDPDYSMAGLMRRALDVGLPAERWREYAPRWLAARSAPGGPARAADDPDRRGRG